MALEEEKPMVLPPPDSVQETSLIKSKERVQKHGEVFTPDWMVKKMLSYPEIQEKLKDIHATFLEPAGGEYQRAAENQQRITKGIQSAEETNAGIGDAIDRSTDRIAESQGTVQSARESIDRTEDDLDTAGRILEDCQRILSRVRERKQ